MIRINILPKIYDEIPIYQQFINELKTDIPRIEAKLPIINEEIALLLRYEIEIDPEVRFSFTYELHEFRTKEFLSRTFVPVRNSGDFSARVEIPMTFRPGSKFR